MMQVLRLLLGGGALWIWNCFSELFPEAIELIDVYHAKEEIWDLSKVIYGSATDTSKRWTESTVQILKVGEIETWRNALE